jgi:TorA maturation chaperone TorD
MQADKVRLEMRDQGLQKAINAVGGVAALARRIGIAQPSVSNWTKVPADRLASIEQATGVPRAELRPDLFEASAPVDDIDRARAQVYLLLGSLVRQAPTSQLLAQIATLKGDSSVIGMLHFTLAAAAAETTAEIESREFFRLFVGVGRGELLPYASYYMTGFLHERPLARVREDLRKLEIERAEGLLEPEDHLGILLDVMSGLILGQFTTGVLSEQDFFDRHIKSWGAKVFADIESCAQTNFYRAVARLGLAFLEIDNEAFALPA